MRWRSLCIGLALISLLPLCAGCAKLNEWLEGTVGEEKAKEGLTPEEELAKQQGLLKTGLPAERKAAITTIGGLKLEAAITEVLTHIDDADPAVVSAVLSVLQSVTGFAEKTEDERQLDPEGYDKQVKYKQMVVEQGLAKLAAVLKGSDLIRYGAMIVFYNLGRAPVVPENAGDALRQQAVPSIAALAGDPKARQDARLLALDTLVLYEAKDELTGLARLLEDPAPEVRARMALALGQAGSDPATAAPRLLALAKDTAQPWDVRWAAAAGLGKLGSPDVSGLEQPYGAPIPEELQNDPSPHDQSSPLDAYRAYALANASSAEAQKLVTELNQQMDKVATEAEDQLSAERKKGYHR